MYKGKIHIYVPEQDQKSDAAYGKILLEALEGKKIVIICFYETGIPENTEFLKKLEPEIKLFYFENIRNGINFTRKVLSTEACDLLVLPDLVKAVENGCIEKNDIDTVFSAQSEADTVLIGQPVGKITDCLADKDFRIVC